MGNFYKELLATGAVITGLGALVFILIAVPAVFIDQASCSQTWKDSGFGYRYQMFSGCQIKDPKTGYWYRPNDYLFYKLGN